MMPHPRSACAYALSAILTLAALAAIVSIAMAGESDLAALRKTAAQDGSNGPTSASSSTTATIARTQAAVAADSIKPAASATKLTAAQRAAVRTFERARAAFTGFCKDWESKLSRRERDNLAAIKWKTQNGWMIGQYVGYSKVRSCTCKQSTRGQPIGKLTYGETSNYLTGKTVDEAKHAKPKTTLATETTEIFGWGKKGWEY